MADIKHYLQIKKDIENKNAKNTKTGKAINPTNVVKGVFSNFAASAEDASKGKREEEDYRIKIRKHRIRIAAVITICAFVFLSVGVIAAISINNMTYSDYTVVKSISKEDTESAKYIDYGEGYIRYSNDGVSYFSRKGTEIWNQTYQMKNPQIKICGKAVAVGDLNGTSIYLFDDTGVQGNIDTSLSISQIEVSEQGLVAAVLEDTNANYINLYKDTGEMIYTAKTTLDQNGYPLAISISDDATKLIASYVYVNGESINTNVVFYNYSEVGQNETDNIVGGFNQYGSTLVPEVKFINNTYAVAVGENVISLYKIKEYPSLYKDISIDGEIDKVFTSDKYIGLIMKNNNSGDAYKMVVYNLNGNIVLNTSFNTEYDVIKFDGKSIIMYNDTVFSLMNMNGKIQYEQTFDLPIKSVLSLGSKGNYILVSSKYIQEIKLK